MYSDLMVELPTQCNYCHRRLRTPRSQQHAAENGGYGPVCIKKVRAKQAEQVAAIAKRLDIPQELLTTNLNHFGQGQ